MKLIAAAIGVALLSSGAYAADIYVPPAAEVASATSAYNWTGFYAGVLGGYGWGSTIDANNALATSQQLTGWSGGVEVGYNHQLDGNLVVGVAADISAANIGASWDGDTPNDPYYTSDKITSYGTLRARVGYAADSVLLYATGGVAWASMDHTLGCSPAHAPGGTTGCKVPFEASGSAGSVGYTVGAGVEVAVTDSISLKGEYLYTNFASNKVTLVDVNWPSLGNRDFKTDFGTVRGGINFHF